MSKKIVLAFLLLSALPLIAQSTPPSSGTQVQVGPGRQGGTPCWQQIGIDKSIMEQRWSIERDTHSQVEAVCTNSSLTPQQKRQQVREIREQARQKMDGLISPQQEQALTSCQQQRGMNHQGPGTGTHQGMGGGCGAWQRNGQQPGSTPNGTSNSNNQGNSHPTSQNE